MADAEVVNEKVVADDGKLGVKSQPAVESTKDGLESVKGVSLPKYGKEVSPAGQVSKAEAKKFKEFHDAHKEQFDKSRSQSKLSSSSKEEREAWLAVEKELRPGMAKFLGLPVDRANSLRIISVESTFKKSDGSEVPATHMEVTAGLSYIHSTMAFSKEGELLFSTAKDFKRYNEGVDTLKRAGREYFGEVRASIKQEIRAEEMKRLEPLRSVIEKDFSDLLRKDEKLQVTVGLQKVSADNSALYRYG